MTPERWRRIEELYHAALAQNAAERAAFLAEACAGDEGLRQEVESLFANPASVEGFLDRPAMAVAAQMISNVGASRLTSRASTVTGAEHHRLPSAEPIDQARFIPGAMLAGRYRIVSLLGRGGMDI